MNKKIGIGIIALIAIIGSGFLVGLIAVSKIKDSLKSPILLGGTTVYVGKVADQSIGFFKGSVTFNDSKVEHKKNNIRVPTFKVEYSGTVVKVQSDQLIARIASLKDTELIIENLKAQTPIQELMSAEGKKSLLISLGSIRATETDRQSEWRNIRFDVVKEKHNAWDKLSLKIGEFSSESVEGNLEVKDISYEESQVPLDKRLELAIKVKVGAVSFKTPQEEDGELTSQNLQFETLFSIDGSKDTIFWQTIADTFGQMATVDFSSQGKLFNQYTTKHHPLFSNFSATHQSSQFDLGNQEQLSIGMIELGGSYKKENQSILENYEGSLKDLKLTSEKVSVEAVSVSYEFDSVTNERDYEEFIKKSSELDLSTMDQKALLRLFGAMLGLLNDHSSNGKYQIQDLSISTADGSYKIPEVSLSASVKAKQGVLSFSIIPEVKIDDVKPLLASLNIPVELGALDQKLELSFENWNLKAFQPLLASAEQSNPMALMLSIDPVLQDFIKTKPAIRLAWNGVEKQGATLGIALSYALDHEWPRQFSITSAFMGGKSFKQDLMKALLQSSTLSLNLEMEDLKRLKSLADQATQKPGVGDLMMMQYQSFLQIEDQNAKANLKVEQGKVSLNGKPHFLLQNFLSMFLNR